MSAAIAAIIAGILIIAATAYSVGRAHERDAVARMNGVEDHFIGGTQ